MDAKSREARWRQSYDLQKTQYEARRSRRKENIMNQIAAVAKKQQELEARRAELERQLKKVAEEEFLSFDTFRETAIQQSNGSHTAPDSSPTET